MEKNKIKKDFITEAIAHGNAIDSGDHKKANRIHKKLQSIYNEAKIRNQLDLFYETFEEKNESVKLWAATFSLKSNPVLAEALLNRLSKSNSIIGLSAKTTLQMWKMGKLNLL